MKKYNLSAHKTKIIKTIAISILFINITDIKAAEYAIIANSSSNISDSYQLIGRAFLKQYTIKNANSDYINPVGNSDVNAQKAFYKYTLDKSLDDVNSYWNSQIFSGGSKPVFKISSGSTGLNSNFLTLLHVNNTPNSISYIEYKYYQNASANNKKNVKVLYKFNYPQGDGSQDSQITKPKSKDSSGFSFFGLGKKKPNEDNIRQEQAQEKAEQQQKIAKEKAQEKAEQQQKIAQAQEKAEQQQKIAQEQAQEKAEQQQKIAKEKAQKEAKLAKIAQEKKEAQEQAAEQQVEAAQQKAKEAKQKAQAAEQAAEQQARIAQQQAADAMKKAQERIKKVKAELKAKEQARAKAEAIRQAQIQAAKARARAKAIAQAQQEAAQAQLAAKQAQARAKAIEEQAKAQAEAAEQKAKAAEEMLQQQSNQQDDYTQSNQQNDYEQGPAIQVVKKPSQYQSQQEATSNAPNLDIDSQIDQATQNIQSAGN